MRSLVALVVALALLASACGGDGGGGGGGDGGDSLPAVGPGAVSATLRLLETAVDVALTDDAAFEAAADGQPLALGNAVRTDATGFAQIDYPDGSLTRLDTDTVFAVTSLGTPEAPSIRAELDLGRTWQRVTDATATGGRFEIDTGTAVAAVRGTAFEIGCDATRTCTFAVAEGLVEVTTILGQSVLLGPGMTAVVEPDGTLRPAELLPPGTTRAAPWIERNLDLDGQDGIGAPPPTDARLAGPGPAQWAVALTVSESTDPSAPAGSLSEVAWTIQHDCPEGACGGSIEIAREGGADLVVPFVLDAGEYRIGGVDRAGTPACIDAGVDAFDLATEGVVGAATVSEDGIATTLRGALVEVFAPRPEAVATGCVEDIVLRRVTIFHGTPPLVVGGGA